MRIATICLFALVFYPATSAIAADTSAQTTTDSAKPAPAASGTYKLTFVVKEFAAEKLTGSRSYSAVYFEGRGGKPGSIRAEDQVPTMNSDGHPGFQHIGVFIDFMWLGLASEVTSLGSPHVSINVDVDITSIAPPATGAANSQPLIREQRWGSSLALELNKPTLLFSSDDPTADRKTQVEVTAVKMN